MSITRTLRRRLSLAAGLLIAALLSLLALPGVAVAITLPMPPAPPDSDANCETLPTSYPGNGVPVPSDAFCAVVTTADGIPTAEVWAWADDGGLNWYNYLADGYSAGSGSMLTMCATDDESAADVDYECTTDSYYLLFTVDNLFVTWPATTEVDHYFCEAVDVVGPTGIPLTSYACGTVAGTDTGDGATAPPVPPTTDPPTSSPPTSPPEAPPPSAPTAPQDDDPAGSEEPSSAPVAPADPVTTTAPSAAGTSGPGTQDPRGLPEEAFDPGPAPTPVDSQSVALVDGAGFPVALVFALAGALALGGVGVLAGPSALAAIRRRI